MERQAFMLSRLWIPSLALLGLLAPSAVTAQEEETTRDVWVLGFEFEALRMYTPTSGPHKGRVYWYMLYTIENKSDEDREIFLSIDATSDRGRDYRDTFLPLIEHQVERKVGQERWGQTDRFAELADRDPGDEKYNYTVLPAGEKRRCIAVFNRLDAGANSIAIEVWGLSNDLERVQLDSGELAIKERVRRLTFKRIGDDREIDQDRFEFLTDDWVKKSVREE